MASYFSRHGYMKSHGKPTVLLKREERASVMQHHALEMYQYSLKKGQLSQRGSRLIG